MTRVLLAPDKFKGSLSAPAVADALARGLLSRRPDAEVRRVPVADGGDGTVDAAVAAGFTRVPATVHGPLGEPGIETSFALDGHVAVVEMADACGLLRLPPGVLDPLRASSRGLGDVIRAAVDAGARRVVVGIGGSASTDGGAGMLQALGARIVDAEGREIPSGAAGLGDVTDVDLSPLRQRMAGVDVVVACDVDNPLLGPRGAAAVYGPQKGATADDVERLEARLARWAHVLGSRTSADAAGAPGAGAAGGVGFAALAALGARLAPGIDLVLDLVGFDQHVQGADLVVVGEGSLDEQSLAGKAPVGVARRARDAGVPVVAVCGRRDVDGQALLEAGIGRALALTDLEPDESVCRRDAARLLEAVGGVVADMLPRSATPD